MLFPRYRFGREASKAKIRMQLGRTRKQARLIANELQRAAKPRRPH